MYVITGATGNTGSRIAETLLAAGKKVRVVGRDPGRLERFTRQGADAAVADITDAASLTKAFAGAQAAYAMIPPALDAPDGAAYQDRVSRALAAAIEANGLTHAVVLSSIGADKASGTGPIAGLRGLEQRLRAIAGLNVLSLRAGYFMENILPQIGAIRSLGMLVGALRPDLPLPMIATRDIAAVAADALLRLNFSGKRAQELQGARDVSYVEVARAVGAAIGKPDLAYHQLAPAEFKPILTQMGISPSVAELLLELADALNRGHVRALEPRSAENTTPTTLEAFVADVFLPAYRGQAARA